VLSSPDGRDMMINKMRRSDIFGDLAALTGELRTA
jgi:hypothetical protein